MARPAALLGAGTCLAAVLGAMAWGWRVRPLFVLAGAAAAVGLMPAALHEPFLPLALLTSPLTAWGRALVFLLPSALCAVFLLQFRGNRRLNDLPSFLAGQVLTLCGLWLLGGPFMVGAAVYDGAVALATLLPAILLVAAALPRWRRQPGGRLLVAGLALVSSGGITLLLALTNIVNGPLAETFFILAQLLGICLLAAAPVQMAEVAQTLAEINRDLKSGTANLADENRQLQALALRLENDKTALHRRREVLEAENRDAEARLRELTLTADAFYKLRESIDYARRIQQALVPSETQLRESLGESFILNLPRDNVSGDFLWCARFPDGWSMLCVADCTGHGVPGAFMSALGTMLLGQIVIERNVRRPDQVLFAIDRHLREALATNGASVDDGMEAAALLLSPDRRTALFCGARLGLYRSQDGQASIVDGTKRAIGGRERPRMPAFEVRRVALRPGETLFLSSDGYQDQLGGPDGRRYLSRRFRDTLGWVGGLPLKDQGTSLQQVLRNWQADRPQTDDILVVGVKV